MNEINKHLFKAIDFLVRIESGPDAGKAYRIQPPKISIGRDPSCHITLTDPKVSRQQCVIKFTNNIICEDVSSRKTTLINGKACGQSLLKPGDRISFGQTVIVFYSKTNQKTQSQLPGQAPPQPQINGSKKQRNFYLLAGFLVFIILSIVFLENSPQSPALEKVATQKDLQKQIKESQERSSLIRKSRLEKRKLNNKNYLYNVENHFISGFRDFQNGRYGRALDSFGTTISVDKNHLKAHLYARSAKRKRAQLIDTHLRDGQKYKAKMMFNRCAAEFEKALILINQKSSQKYRLARNQMEECRLLKTGAYQ